MAVENGHGLDSRLRPQEQLRALGLGRAEAVAAARTREQLVETALVDDRASADDRDPVTELLDLGEDVTREQDRDSLTGELLHELAHVAHPGGVEPGRRLVQQQELRVAQQRRRDAEPLPHAVRVAANPVLRAIAQLDRLEHLVDARRRRPAVEVGEQAQVATAGEVRIEPRSFHEAGNAVERPGPELERIAAEQPRVSRSRTNQPEQHAERRGLPRSVRPEVAEHVAALDGQVDMVDGDDLAVALDEATSFDRLSFCVRHLMRAQLPLPRSTAPIRPGCTTLRPDPR